MMLVCRLTNVESARSRPPAEVQAQARRADEADGQAGAGLVGRAAQPGGVRPRGDMQVTADIESDIPPAQLRPGDPRVIAGENRERAPGLERALDLPGPGRIRPPPRPPARRPSPRHSARPPPTSPYPAPTEAESEDWRWRDQPGGIVARRVTESLNRSKSGGQTSTVSLPPSGYGNSAESLWLALTRSSTARCSGMRGKPPAVDRLAQLGERRHGADCAERRHRAA